MRARSFKPTIVSRRVMSFTVLVLDFTLVFLQFGAATAIAGLRGGFSDLGLANFCDISRMCVPPHRSEAVVTSPRPTRLSHAPRRAASAASWWLPR